MNKSKFFCLFVFLLLFASSCSTNKYYHRKTDKSTVCIGTFNLEWLGDGVKDQKRRINRDYQNFAEIIANSGMEVVGVEEIENSVAIERIMKYLPDYKYIVGKKGGTQNVGIIYKNTVEVCSLGEYSPLKVEPERTRPGLIARCKKGDFDWIIMIVHLKSTSRYDDSPEKREQSFEIRNEQAKVLRFWADSVLKYSDEKDVVIVGDFNDNPKRDDKVIAPLSTDTELKFLSQDLVSCKNKMWNTIDHIVVSKSANTRYISGSVHAYNFFSTLTEIEAEGLSDHCPVMAVFDVTKEDND